jgi:hypothetical protein
MRPLEAALENTVEHHWQTALGRHRLFDGRVVCADRITPSRIDGHWSEYRRNVA